MPVIVRNLVVVFLSFFTVKNPYPHLSTICSPLHTGEIQFNKKPFVVGNRQGEARFNGDQQ